MECGNWCDASFHGAGPDLYLAAAAISKAWRSLPAIKCPGFLGSNNHATVAKGTAGVKELLCPESAAKNLQPTDILIKQSLG